jgi:DNA polymerase-1
MKMDETFLRYSALDSACMVEIHNKFWPSIHTQGYDATYNMTIALFPVLTYLQTKGMKVNHELLAQTREDVLRSAAEKQAELDDLCTHPLNVNSSKQVAQYFYVEKGLPPILKPKTKQITTDDNAMQRIARGTAKNPGLREAKLVQEIRGLQKLYSTYLNMKFDDDGRLRGSYNPRGTKFGRLSSSQTIMGTGMNYQNLPQEFKKFLVADEGKVLIEFDKRQAEWVVVAYLANDANMIQAIRDGLDVHTHTASLMFNVPKEIIKHDSEIVGHSTSTAAIHELRMEDPILRQHYTDQWPKGMSLRQCGKKSNHGLNYDEGFNQFALLNEMEIKEAKRIIELYHSIYPGIRLYYQTVQRQLQKDRTLTNCFGRKVLFMGEWGRDLWKSAYSMLPQSTVVDSLNQGMVRIYHDDLLTKTFDIDLLAQVHDSILMQVPIEVIRDPEKYKIIMDKVNTYTSPTLSYNGNEFKIATDAKVGLNWGSFHKTHNTEGMRDLDNHATILDLLNKGSEHGTGTH